MPCLEEWDLIPIQEQLMASLWHFSSTLFLHPVQYNYVIFGRPLLFSRIFSGTTCRAQVCRAAILFVFLQNILDLYRFSVLYAWNGIP